MATLKDIENMLKDLTKTELKKLLKRVDKELSGHPSDLKALLTAKRYANNHCHCRLKDFIKKFNGVSTKYLGNYIVWHNFVNFAHDSRENKEEIMLNYAIKYPMTETNAMIPNRPATP